MGSDFYTQYSIVQNLGFSPIRGSEMCVLTGESLGKLNVMQMLRKTMCIVLVSAGIIRKRNFWDASS
jgi:hypothetical protein